MIQSSHAALDIERRRPKAEKIQRLLPELETGEKTLRLLEVGTGSGAIAHYFSGLVAPSFQVTAVDVEDQREISAGYEFKRYDGTILPFDDQSFDIVISNHVIEHVGGRAQQRNHLSELCRVLASGGYIYLATPSRWHVVEPHFSLPFLSWIPRRWRDGYVRISGKGDVYDCDPLGPLELRQLMEEGGLPYRNLNIQALKVLIQVERPGWGLTNMAAALPIWCLNVLNNCFPTLIYLVHKPETAELRSVRDPGMRTTEYGN